MNVIFTRKQQCINDSAKWKHDDVRKWKHFPRNWPFVRRIHRSSVNSPHKGQWRGALMCVCDLRLNKRLSKQWWCWWFETPSRTLWRNRNEKTNVENWFNDPHRKTRRKKPLMSSLWLVSAIKSWRRHSQCLYVIRSLFGQSMPFPC